MFGGSKDVAFNQEISDLLGTVRVGRITHNTGGSHGGGRSYSGDDIPIMRPEEVRQLPERQALVIAENGKPIIAKLHRCVEGKHGTRLLAQQQAMQTQLSRGQADGHHPRGPHRSSACRGPPTRIHRAPRRLRPQEPQSSDHPTDPGTPNLRR